MIFVLICLDKRLFFFNTGLPYLGQIGQCRLYQWNCSEGACRIHSNTKEIIRKLIVYVITVQLLAITIPLLQAVNIPIPSLLSNFLFDALRICTFA